MSCAFRKKLEDLVAGRLSPAEARECEGHLPACPGCRAEVGRLRGLRDLLSSYTPFTPSDAELARIDRRVMEALERPPARGVRLPWLEWSSWSFAALTAAALLFVALRPAQPVPTVEAVRPREAGALVGVQAGVERRDVIGARRTGRTVLEGERILCEGGAATLLLGPRTGFHLPRGTELVIDRLEPGRTSLTLSTGEILAEVSPLKAHGQFEVRAHDLVVSVRGTAFAVRRDAASTDILVEHGLVEVRRQATLHRALVATGERLLVEDGELFTQADVVPAGLALTGFPLRLPPVTPSQLLARSSMLLSSNPPSAEVRVEGGFRGETPVELLLPEGTHTVRFAAAGFPPVELEVDFGALSESELAASLVPAALEPAPPDAPEVEPPRGRGLPRPPTRLEDPAIAARREAMLFQVRTHLRDLVRCYEKAMKRNPGLSGELILSITLEPSGVVKQVAAADQADPLFLDCATESVHRWALPGTGEEEHFEIPLQLSPRP